MLEFTTFYRPRWSLWMNDAHFGHIIPFRGCILLPPLLPLPLMVMMIMLLSVLALQMVKSLDVIGRGQLKCDGTRAETRFRLSAKRTSPFKSAVASVQSTAGSRGVRISGSNAGYTMFRGCVKSTGYPLHSPVSPSLPLPCVTVCYHISTGIYLFITCSLSLSVSKVTGFIRFH